MAVLRSSSQKYWTSIFFPNEDVVMMRLKNGTIAPILLKRFPRLEQIRDNRENYKDWKNLASICERRPKMEGNLGGEGDITSLPGFTGYVNYNTGDFSIFVPRNMYIPKMVKGYVDLSDMHRTCKVCIDRHHTVKM